MAARLRLEFRISLRCVHGDCDSAGFAAALSHLCAIHSPFAATCDRWNPAIYGMARGISVSRHLAEPAIAELRKRMGRPDRRFNYFWVFAYPARTISQLEVRAARFDCGIFLRT